jgi:hypothetical protein
MGLACQHRQVYPDGTCAECGRLATLLPGLSEAHKVIPRPDRYSAHAKYCLIRVGYGICNCSAALDKHAG